MFRSITADSSDSDVFYLERSSGEQSPARKNRSDILNSKELPGAHANELIAIPSVASLEPEIVTIESNSNEP